MGNDMVMDLLSKRSSLELLQNCDLPPPTKVFVGPANTGLLSVNGKYHKLVHKQGHEETDRIGIELEKLELLKALQLSQTRAREAEKKVVILGMEKDRLLKAFMDDSSQLFAYRQWVNLSELELLKLRRQAYERRSCSNCHRPNGRKCTSNNDGSSGDGSHFTWFMTLALFFSIAGVGLAFGCRNLQ